MNISIPEWLKPYLAFKGDRILWYMIFLLAAISLVVVFSSTDKLAYTKMDGNTIKPLAKQFGMLALAVAAILFFQNVHYKYFITFAGITCALSILLLVLPYLEGGMRVNEASRWFKVPILGFSIQPSEFAKIGVVMYMSRVIAFERRDGYCLDRALIPIAIRVIPILGLIFYENFSTSVFLAIICLLLLFVGRIREKTMMIILASAAVLSAIFLLVIFNTEALDNLGRIGEVKTRLRQENTLQPEQAKIAIALGGLTGVGTGRSVQRNFIPNSHSDYIYAIIVEEYGFAGGATVMGIYLIILYRIVLIIRRSSRAFPALLVTGLGLAIVLQALFHVLVNVGLFFETGQPLPLVSTGGTSIALVGVALGMIQSVAHTFSDSGQREEQEQKEKRSKERQRAIERLKRQQEEEDAAPLSPSTESRFHCPLKAAFTVRRTPLSPSTESRFHRPLKAAFNALLTPLYLPVYRRVTHPINVKP
ncbi:MAG: FtsW/RodA/SpoVE family cell cycle protein [Odoribacteraceae bacterium]|jgi:cell division protein FtsW|nr:FtsW/RodA/SpoVE family cell cycle protein [Odoribacteraceae bacterium]